MAVVVMGQVKVMALEMVILVVGLLMWFFIKYCVVCYYNPSPRNKMVSL